MLRDRTCMPNVCPEILQKKRSNLMLLYGFFYQDIRKFFGVVTPGKKPECGIARKEKPQNKERNSGGTSTLKEIKVSI